MANAKRTRFSIVDGDTIRLNRALNGNNFVRLAGVDAPELNTKAGHQAKQELKQMLRGKSITIQTVGKSYGRNVAVVRARGTNINNAMRRRGY
jgi:endonuclease YncB( thermonuclease family)